MKRLVIMLLAGSLAGAQTAPPRKAPAKKSAPAKKDPAPAPPAAPANKWPVEKLAVEGNKDYTPEQVFTVAGIKIGQLAGRAEFDAARDRLVACGAFETVGYKFEPGADREGYVATFQVTEVQPAFPVRFEELGVPAKDVDAMLRARDPLYSPDRLPATKTMLDRYTAWIQEYLASKNVTEKIAGTVVALATDRFAIVFRPARDLPAVAQVTFKGNQVVPQGALREAISATGIGTPYTESSFRDLLNSTIRTVYEQRGRLHVSFPEVRAEPTKDVEGVHVFVTVDEGQVYELGKVEISGTSPVEPAALLKAGDFKTGDVANMDKVAEGLEKIRKAVRHAGYLEAKVTSERKLDEGKKTADVAVHINAGPQYAMGKLTLVGLDLDGEAEINRMWTMREGKTLNPDYPDMFLNRIKEQGTFENLGNTKADLKVDEKKHVADVTLIFAGANPGQQPGRRGRQDR